VVPTSKFWFCAVLAFPNPWPPSIYYLLSKIILRLTLQSLDAVRRICLKRVLLIGMSHDFDYHEHNKILAEWSKE